MIFWRTILGALGVPQPDAGAGSVGTSNKYAREDHVHPATTGGVVPSIVTPLVESGTGAVGVALPYSREDHIHPIVTPAAIGAPSGSGTSTGTNTGDQIIPVASATTPAKAAGDGVVGVAASFARGDHVHAINTPADIGAVAIGVVTVGGTVDAITLTPPSVLASYAAGVGQSFLFKASGNNTVSPPTINISGLGALNTTMGSVATPAGGLISGNYYFALLESATSVRLAPFDAISSNGDTFNGAVSFAAGAVGLPALYFSTNTTTGFYQSAANVIGIAVSGVAVGTIAATGVTWAGVTNSSFEKNTSITVNSTAALTAASLLTAYNYFTGTAGASFVVTFPATPFNGQIVSLVCTVARTVASAAGVTGFPTTILANTGYSFQYVTASATWYNCG